MRLSEYRHLLGTVETNESSWLGPGLQQGDFIQFGNLEKFRSQINKLRKLPALQTYIDPLIHSPIFATSADEVKGPLNELRALSYHAGRLRQVVGFLKEFVNEQVPQPRVEEVVIRLPDASEFASVVKDCAVIQRCLEQVLLEPEIAGKVDLSSWEDGSHWIRLALGTQLAVWFVGSIINSAAVVRNAYHRDRIFEQHVRRISAETRMIEEFAEAASKHTELLIQAEAKALAEKHFPPERVPEISSRLRVTIKEFADLVERGAEFKPALMPPADAPDNTFPNFERLEFATSEIKQLEDKK